MTDVEEILAANGIDAETGEPLFEALSEPRLAERAMVGIGLRGIAPLERASRPSRRLAFADQPPPGFVDLDLDLSGLLGRQPDRLRSTVRHFLGPRNVDDPNDLSRTGWGVIFAEGADPAVREALCPLLEHRQQQAGDLYRELETMPEETGYDFGRRHGFLLETPPPKVMPYYLLIVGDPATIRYDFQYWVDRSFAVGRLHFERAEDYAAYAHAVVTQETMASPRREPPRAVFFGTRTPRDAFTRGAVHHLLRPLVERLRTTHPGWSVQDVVGDPATKAGLAELLGGRETPDLLFVSSQGEGYRHPHARQRDRQGALICQDWPGSGHPVQPDQAFAAEDVDRYARLAGLVAFLLCCHGAGVPEEEEPAFARDTDHPARMAAHDFVARLPQRLLGHDAGGALAVVSHVERVWSTSYLLDHRAGPEIEHFVGTMRALLDGDRLGWAMTTLQTRGLLIWDQLAHMTHDRRLARNLPSALMARYWLAAADARTYAVVGDPAVRLDPHSARHGSAAETSRGDH